MQNVKAAANQIDRLLATFPAPTNTDNRVRFGAYLTAIEDYDADTIVKSAVTNFLKGAVAGHNNAYAPSPAQVATECRRILNAELEELQRNRAAILQIEQREEKFHEDPPMLRKMTVERELQRAVVVQPPEDTPEQQAQRRAATSAYLATHDAKFVDTSPEATARRLFKAKV